MREELEKTELEQRKERVSVFCLLRCTSREDVNSRPWDIPQIFTTFQKVPDVQYQQRHRHTQLLCK